MAIVAAQARMILNTFMLHIRDNMVSSNLVSWNVHTRAMNDRNGLIVSQQVPPSFVVVETVGGVKDLSAGAQDVVFGAQTFTLNRTFNVAFSATDIESVVSMQEARRSKALRAAAESMASKLDNHIMGVASRAFPLITGTAGAGVTTPQAFDAARTRLAEASLESDARLSGVLTHADATSLNQFIYNNNASMSTEGARAMAVGYGGMLGGVPIKKTNTLGIITTGTRGAGTVAGAAQNVNYSAAADAGSNAGYYLTQTLNIAGIGAAATVKAGEILSIAGVTAYNPNLERVRPYTQQFTVIEDAVADGAGAATIRIYPAIIVAVPGSATGANAVNTAHATVDAAPANGAAVTFYGNASTAYTPRLIFRDDAITVHSVPLSKVYTGQAFPRPLADVQRDNVVPLAPRLWLYSDPDTGIHTARMDVFVEAQPADRALGVRFFGA